MPVAAAAEVEAQYRPLPLLLSLGPRARGGRPGGGAISLADGGCGGAPWWPAGEAAGPPLLLQAASTALSCRNRAAEGAVVLLLAAGIFAAGTVVLLPNPGMVTAGMGAAGMVAA